MFGEVARKYPCSNRSGLASRRDSGVSTDEGSFPMETTYPWHDSPNGGTHMTSRNRGEPSGFANLAAPLMSAQMRRSTIRDLKLLKSLMETRQSA